MREGGRGNEGGSVGRQGGRERMGGDRSAYVCVELIQWNLQIKDTLGQLSCPL